MKASFKVLPLIAALTAVSAFAQTPAEITPPAGNKAAMTLAATGLLNYECKAVADKPGSFAWTFAGPDAKLWDANKKEVGKYYGGPTWESTDGSKVTGKQLAVSPGVAGAIPLQLVQAAPTTGKGAMADVTYIQRLKTVGGVAPATPACAAANVGAKTTVGYTADYVFFKKG
ncbi:MAG: DUF3455 domain-containing protein [Betaproteobacteria bacterium]